MFILGPSTPMFIPGAEHTQVHPWSLVVLLIKQYVIVYTINDEQRKKEIKYDQLMQIRKDMNKRINT